MTPCAKGEDRHLLQTISNLFTKFTQHTLDEIFIIVLIPIIFIFIGVLAARLGRKDGDTSHLGNTYAVGTSVSIMCLSTAIVECFGAGTGDRERFLYWIIIFFVLTWWSTDRDRYASWERDVNGMPGDKKSLLSGIIIPNLVAIILFSVYKLTG